MGKLTKNLKEKYPNEEYFTKEMVNYLSAQVVDGFYPLQKIKNNREAIPK